MVYYADGTTYGGSPDTAPRSGVVYVRQTSKDGVQIDAHSSDWYWWCEEDGLWYCSVLCDDLLVRAIAGVPVLKGAQVPRETWLSIVREAAGR